MTSTTEYLEAVNRPGAFQRVRWTSAPKPAKAFEGTDLRKVAVATVRTGIEYANLGVNEGRETGALPWGEWLEYPYIVVHKGQYYARLYVLEDSVKVTHYVNGQETDRETFGGYLTRSARESRRPTGGTITVKLANVTLL